MSKSQELFHHAVGPNSRSIQLTLAEDGSLVMVVKDSNATEEMFGQQQHVHAVTIPPQATSALAFALLAEQFRGKPNAVEVLRDLCRKEGVPHGFKAAADET